MRRENEPHRLGVILGTPFVIAAAVLAFLQWQNPTGPLVTKLSC
jgi:hypothetical protein